MGLTMFYLTLSPAFNIWYNEMIVVLWHETNLNYLFDYATANDELILSNQINEELQINEKPGWLIRA